MPEKSDEAWKREIQEIEKKIEDAKTTLENKKEEQTAVDEQREKLQEAKEQRSKPPAPVLILHTMVDAHRQHIQVAEFEFDLLYKDALKIAKDAMFLTRSMSSDEED
ncbi:hypothetical protein D6C99_03966 [Aureobasidium pullulans]|nr:hypothetical protein D6C99_03966 [Aureobasidium pullulans]